jgi:hypothetical protein
MRNARARLVDMVEDLERNPNVEVLDVVLHGPTAKEDIATATRLANGRLPAGVEEFYREVGSFRLEWRHAVAEIQAGDLSDEGMINILPVAEVFGDWVGATWEPESEEFRPVKPFDMFVPEACAAFLLPEKTEISDVFRRPGDSVAFHSFGAELCDTGYTFDEYLQRLLAARGYRYWLKTLCPGAQHSTETQDFRGRMPRIFPDHDDSLFHPKPA